MPSAVLHIQVQIISYRLRSLGRQDLLCRLRVWRCSSASSAACLGQYQEGQAELSLSVSGFWRYSEREEEKNPQKQKQNKTKMHTCFPMRVVHFLGFFTPYTLEAKISTGCFGKHMHKHTHTQTHTHCPGGAFCQMSNFPNFLSRVVSGRSSRSSRSAGPRPGEFPIAIPSLADRPGWLHSLQPSSKAPQ